MDGKRGRDGFLLNEPARVIVGGATRKSVRVDRAALPQIARRERLSRALIRHDGKQPTSPERVTVEDVPLLKVIAEEPFASGVPPVVRYQALRVLGHLAPAESRGLLEALEATGDDAHVRGIAAAALGRRATAEPREVRTTPGRRRITGSDQ